MKTKLQKFIDVRQSILDGQDPLHPDWKHHYSFLKLAQAIQADDPVSDLVVKSGNANTDVANPPSDPKRKANT